MTHVLLLLLLLALPLKVRETNRFLQSCFAATLMSTPMTSQRLRLKSQPDDKTRPCLKSQPDDLVVAKFPQQERSYIEWTWQPTTHRTHHHHHHQSCEQRHFGPNVGLQVVVGRPQVVGGCCLTKWNQWIFLLHKWWLWDGELRERESVIREHVLLSHIALKPFFCLWYIPPSTSKKWQKDVSDGNVKTPPCKT